jgi:hypothetical protein
MLSVPSALNPHQSRQARRLYVGNIPPGVSDTQLAEFVNLTMFNAGKLVATDFLQMLH